MVLLCPRPWQRLHSSHIDCSIAVAVVVVAAVVVVVAFVFDHVTLEWVECRVPQEALRLDDDNVDV